MKNQFEKLYQKINHFLNLFQINVNDNNNKQHFISGEFSLFPNSNYVDLYGTVDALYSLFSLGLLETKTTRNSRELWAKKILECQDDKGWFTKKNLRGHSKEHATAYSLGALELLAIDDDENYIDHIKPIPDLSPLLTCKETFNKWIEHLDFELNPKSILKKKLGWHYIWRGSHVGGGIAAIIGMTNHLFSFWWEENIDGEAWFSWFFGWLNENVNPSSGYWQRGLWNNFYKKPTLIDIGGAIHFFWIYDKKHTKFLFPENVINSTLSLQKSSGLYKNHPFCIDLDGNFSVIRAYLQLSDDMKNKYRDRVYQSAERSFEGIVNAFLEKPLSEIYKDSHGLPGALAALVECKKLPGFKYAELIRDWEHPLDKTWWL